MNILLTILLYGMPATLLFSALLFAIGLVNPRVMLQDFPKDVQALVPSKTPDEKRQTIYWFLAFLGILLVFPALAAASAEAAHQDFLEIFLSAFGVNLLVNLVDWLVIDWLIVCTITPRFVTLPGTEGMAGYKDYAPHFKGFLIGTALSAVIGLIITTLVVVL